MQIIHLTHHRPLGSKRAWRLKTCYAKGRDTGIGPYKNNTTTAPKIKKGARGRAVAKAL